MDWKLLFDWLIHCGLDPMEIYADLREHAARKKAELSGTEVPDTQLKLFEGVPCGCS